MSIFCGHILITAIPPLPERNYNRNMLRDSAFKGIKNWAQRQLYCWVWTQKRLPQFDRNFRDCSWRPFLVHFGTTPNLLVHSYFGTYKTLLFQINTIPDKIHTELVYKNRDFSFFAFWRKKTVLEDDKFETDLKKDYSVVILFVLYWLTKFKHNRVQHRNYV